MLTEKNFKHILHDNTTFIIQQLTHTCDNKLSSDLIVIIINQLHFIYIFLYVSTFNTNVNSKCEVSGNIVFLRTFNSKIFKRHQLYKIDPPTLISVKYSILNCFTF